MDRNYGGLFIFWDRLFGTFQEEQEDEPAVFGIRGALKSWSPVKALTHVYIDMARDSWGTARWSDKLRVWVARTGWRPADVALHSPSEKTDLSHFKRYDPKVGWLVSVYCLFQLMSVGLLLDGMQGGEFAYWHGVVGWATLLATTVTTALWLEDRSANTLQLWELLRLGAMGLLLLYFWSAGVSVSALAPAFIYAGLNVLFLVFLLRPQPVHNSEAAS
jgi:hypothetical protein